MAQEKIVYATDLSDPSRFALPHAAAQAAATKARLAIVHVQELTSKTGEAALYGPLKEEELRRALGSIVPEAPDIPYEHHLLIGDPADEIVRFAEEQQASLIVMGTHGRTGLSRVLMGSVAERVLRKATCPVLVVKPPAPA